VTSVEQFGLLMKNYRKGYQHNSKDIYSVLIFLLGSYVNEFHRFSSFNPVTFTLSHCLPICILLSVIFAVRITIMQCKERNLCFLLGDLCMYKNRPLQKEKTRISYLCIDLNIYIDILCMDMLLYMNVQYYMLILIFQTCLSLLR
jgi:hypothetical protein